jgi:cysteine desulfurase
MFDERTYLDHNATTPVRPQAVAAMGRALVAGGNPSSIHAEGRRARAVVEQAREAVARLVGAQAKNVTFTSGATEALNLALTPALQSGNDTRDWHLFMPATEHPAVLNGHRFSAEAVTVLPVGPSGLLDVAVLEQAMTRQPKKRPLLAVQLANSETGVLQPVGDLARSVHERDGLVVCDAVQAVSHLAVNMADLGADLMAVSAHKIGGPAGAGALIRMCDAVHVAEPVVRGGGQEKGLRAGTENVAGIAGFGAAAACVVEGREADAPRVRMLRDRFEAGLREICREAAVFGANAPRLPNTSAFALPGLRAETALIALDLAGYAVSSGSACSSGKVKSSHVLDAMGVNTDIRTCMLRVSLGWTTRDTDVDGVLAALRKQFEKLSATGKILAA